MYDDACMDIDYAILDVFLHVEFDQWGAHSALALQNSHPQLSNCSWLQELGYCMSYRCHSHTHPERCDL